jgi:hypothetical protein
MHRHFSRAFLSAVLLIMSGFVAPRGGLRRAAPTELLPANR